MMRTRLTILGLLLAMLCAPLVQAQQGVTPRLVVLQKSGQTVRYELAEQPVTTFENGLLVIKTSNAIVEYQLADILRYTYEGVGTNAIDNAEAEGEGILFKQEGQTFTVANLPVGMPLCLYDTTGELLEQKSGTGLISVSLSSRPSGVYIIKAGKHTLKFVKP